ncbi:hypothetical protein PPHE_a2945 [Pseudoalteromonas phenolica O-BC30]|nr:hypothetical protein [Pseudoalteromonas phenolica O-BC30]
MDKRLPDSKVQGASQMQKLQLLVFVSSLIQIHHKWIPKWWF